MEFKKASRRRHPVAATPTRVGTAPIVVRPNVQADPEPVLLPEAQKKPASRMRRILLTKKTAALAVAGCLVLGVIIYNVSTHDSNADAKRPAYPTVLPKGKTIGELGGWKRVSPPKNDPVFAFTDTLDGVPISVSEQPLPQSFKNNTDSQVANLAEKFNATDKIDASGLAVYVGTSAKGPQSVIFAKNNLLVLIKSEKKVSDKSWAKYAGLLN